MIGGGLMRGFADRAGTRIEPLMQQGDYTNQYLVYIDGRRYVLEVRPDS